MSQIASGSPRDFQYTLTTHAPRERFWRLWTDVSRWPERDTPLEQATLDGVPAQGVSGTLKTRDGRSSRFILSEFRPLEGYTLTTALPLGALEVRRFCTLRSEGTLEFTHHVRFVGLSAGLFSALLGKRFQAALPGVMHKLKALAEREMA